MRLCTTTVLHAIISAALGQFVAAPTDLKTVNTSAGIPVRFKEVPNGICETNANVKSFAGYVDVSATQHMYFWMFEARNGNPTASPLIVRLDGGPGASSMNGLFSEMGPCTIDAAGNVVNNPLSFTQNSNVVFIDQPATVGFSFTTLTKASQNPDTFVITPTDNCTTADLGCGTFSSPDLTLTSNSTVDAAAVFYKTMQGFMRAFPQYSANGVHINGQSYGGHYVPVFADHIVQQNKLNNTSAIHIPLKSVTIEDGFFDTRVQFAAYFNYTVTPGNPYDLSPYNETAQAQLFNNVWGPNGCQEQQAACNAEPPPANINDVCSAADDFCVTNVEQFFDVNALRSEDDIRQLLPSPFPPMFYVSYLNQASVQAAIGASTNFTPASVQVGTAFAGTGDDSRTGKLITDSTSRLLSEGVTVAFFTGDADYDSNMIGAQMVANNVAAQTPQVAAAWAQAGFVNLSALRDGQVPGQTRQADHFSFTRVFFAGHFSAFNAPDTALLIQQRAMAGVDIATGTTAMVRGGNMITKGTPTSEFREGPGTIQNTVTPPGAIYNTTTHVPDLPLGAQTAGKAVAGADVGGPMALHPFATMTSRKMNRVLAAQRQQKRKRDLQKIARRPF
jgi:carboxypeptidase C (cathepsin A)